MLRARTRIGTLLTLVAATFLIGSLLTAAEGGREYEILLDTGEAPLGAYTLTLVYDPGRVHIESIAGGSSTGFGDRPVHNRESFSSGRTRFAAFQTASMEDPQGSVSVARVTFGGDRFEGDLRRRRSQRAPFKIQVDVAADTAGRAIQPRVEVRPVAVVSPGSRASDERRSR